MYKEAPATPIKASNAHENKPDREVVEAGGVLEKEEPDERTTDRPHDQHNLPLSDAGVNQEGVQMATVTLHQALAGFCPLHDHNAHIQKRQGDKVDGLDRR
jgi:hypothetical protein